MALCAGFARLAMRRRGSAQWIAAISPSGAASVIEERPQGFTTYGEIAGTALAGIQALASDRAQLHRYANVCRQGQRLGERGSIRCAELAYRLFRGDPFTGGMSNNGS